MSATQIYRADTAMNGWNIANHTAFLEVLLQVPLPEAATDTESLPWYEIITGIIAIPAALIALPYAYLLIGKTRLESEKTELEKQKTKLEIIEKKHQLSQLGELNPEQSKAIKVITHNQDNRIALLLIVRFIVIYLLLSAWGLFEDGFNLIFTSAIIGVQQVFSLGLSGWSVIPIVIVQNIPKVVYWILFFALAWPLFKDANAFLGIDVKDFFKVSSLRELRGHSSQTKND